MTVSTEVRRGGPYSGTGSTGPFSFTFKTFDASTIIAEQRVTSTDVNTILTPVTDYSVTLNSDQDNNPGGTVTLTNALPVGSTLTLTTDSPRLQTLDLTNPGGFYPKTITDALDKCVILIQELYERLARTAQFPIYDPIALNQLPSAADRADKVLSFDENGIPEAVILVSDIAGAQAAAASALAAAASATASAAAATAAAAEAQASAPVAGTLRMHLTDTVPDGWLIAHGQAVSRTTYATLFAAVGTRFGSGDGSTTFNVFDGRGIVPRGRDNGAGRDPDAASRVALATGGATGDNIGSYQADDFKSHVHKVGVASNQAATGSGKDSVSSVFTSAVDSDTAGGNETRMKNVYVDFIIKT